MLHSRYDSNLEYKGLIYLHARWYDPSIRRFVSQDSYSLLNRYSFVKGNPVNYSDPSGHLAAAQYLGLSTIGMSSFTFVSDILGTGMMTAFSGLSFINDVASGVPLAAKLNVPKSVEGAMFATNFLLALGSVANLVDKYMSLQSDYSSLRESSYMLRTGYHNSQIELTDMKSQIKLYRERESVNRMTIESLKDASSDYISSYLDQTSKTLAYKLTELQKGSFESEAYFFWRDQETSLRNTSDKYFKLKINNGSDGKFKIFVRSDNTDNMIEQPVYVHAVRYNTENLNRTEQAAYSSRNAMGYIYKVTSPSEDLGYGSTESRLNYIGRSTANDINY